MEVKKIFTLYLQKAEQTLASGFLLFLPNAWFELDYLCLRVQVLVFSVALFKT